MSLNYLGGSVYGMVRNWSHSGPKNTVEPLYNEHCGTSYFWLLLLQYRGFPLSEVKNVLVTPVVTTIFVLIMEGFSTVSLIQRV